MIRQKIKAELNKFLEITNPSKIPHDKQVKSFVLFNVSKEKEAEIKEIVASEFLLIEKPLKSQRQIEIQEMLKGIDWVNKKYSDLILRYEGTEVQSDIFQWADEAYKNEYERVIDISTRLKNLTSNLSLQDVNLRQFIEDKEQLKMLNETLDFVNLYRYHHDDDFRRYYTRTADEQKYDALDKNIHAINTAKYMYCYNIDLLTDMDQFEHLFKSICKWDHLYWSVFCLSVSQQEFESMASDFLKTELYYNRTLVHLD